MIRKVIRMLLIFLHHIFLLKKNKIKLAWSCARAKFKLIHLMKNLTFNTKMFICQH